MIVDGWWPAQKDLTQFMVVNYQNLMEERDKLLKIKYLFWLIIKIVNGDKGK